MEQQGEGGSGWGREREEKKTSFVSVSNIQAKLETLRAGMNVAGRVLAWCHLRFAEKGKRFLFPLLLC